LENRLSYSAFKHFNAFQVLLGMDPPWVCWLSGNCLFLATTQHPSWEEKWPKSKIKKRKLKEAVHVLVDEGGHRVMDEEGMAGLEVRGVDDGLVDEMVGAGLVDPDQMSDED
jgi:hypothetical protein